MLETDAAWEVFERLEDCYFAVKEATERAAYTVNPGDMLTADEAETLRLMLKTAADRLKRGKEARGLMQAIGTSYKLPNLVERVLYAKDMPGGEADVQFSRSAAPGPSQTGVNNPSDWQELGHNALNDLFRTPGTVSRWHKTVGSQVQAHL